MIARSSPAREALKAGRARVRSELLAETNGSYTTSELSYFYFLSLLVLGCSRPVRSKTPANSKLLKDLTVSPRGVPSWCGSASREIPVGELRESSRSVSLRSTPAKGGGPQKTAALAMTHVRILSCEI
jgi:hypothetical protein